MPWRHPWARLPHPVASPFVDSATGPLDEALVADARSGDREALEQLLVRHQPWVLNIAVRMLWRRADAEDATQEILVKIVKALPAFRGESVFRTWLYRIAVNHILDLRRTGLDGFGAAAFVRRQRPDTGQHL